MQITGYETPVSATQATNTRSDAYRWLRCSMALSENRGTELNTYTSRTKAPLQGVTKSSKYDLGYICGEEDIFLRTPPPPIVLANRQTSGGGIQRGAPTFFGTFLGALSATFQILIFALEHHGTDCRAHSRGHFAPGFESIGQELMELCSKNLPKFEDSILT